MINLLSSGQATAGAVMFGGDLLAADSQRRATDDTNKANKEIARDNALMQREFAQQGVRWKVEDAKKAGIHPLYALGANTNSFSPVAIGHETDNSQANMYSSMGQNISRAIQSTRTQEERDHANLQIASLKADVEGKTLDNQIRLNQLQKMQSVGPAFPGSQNFIPGQGDSGLIKEKPFERIKTRPGSPHAEPGATPGLGYEIQSDGSVVPIPSADLKEKIEDNIFHEGRHFIRNNILPNFGHTGSKPPQSALPPHKKWFWDHTEQSWVPIDREGGGWKFSPGTGFRLHKGRR